MRGYIRYTVLIILQVILLSNLSYSQELRWKAGFHGFFDNREYFNDYAQPQSILGARTFAEGGFIIDDQSEFGVGFDYMFEFGSDPSAENISPIIYYHYTSQPVELYMGAFPRHSLVEMPLVLQNDTFNYYKPNLEGIFLRFSNHWGEQNIWLDWTSRQTLEKRETFLVGATGKARIKSIGFVRYDFLMYHFAGTMQESYTPVRDNGGYTVIGGANLARYTPLDSLNISAGYVGSYDRLRESYDLQFYHGTLAQLYAQYKTFGLRSTFYSGNSQVLMVGDPMYRSEKYNRTDLVFNVLNNGRVNASFELAFHFLPGATDYSQKFTIYVDISGRKKL